MILHGHITVKHLHTGLIDRYLYSKQIYIHIHKSEAHENVDYLQVSQNNINVLWHKNTECVKNMTNK